MEQARPDLAAMIVPLGRALTAAELPFLSAHGLTMWGYVVLSRLGDQPASSQAELAAGIGADKSRIIDVLDDLQERGLITRRPDPSDRRARLIALTPKGRRARNSARAAIQRNEERILSALGPGDRIAFMRALQTLADLPPERFQAL